LQPYAKRVMGQVVVDGPDVMLSSRVAQAFGMALHELTTNALKYGAFSQESGRLVVEWRLRPTTGALHFEWRETGLCGLGEPHDPGFGSTIIDRILPVEVAGTVKRRFESTGMTCTIEVPAPGRD
jgi:two-component sensor histidine kinase